MCAVQISELLEPGKEVGLFGYGLQGECGKGLWLELRGAGTIQVRFGCSSLFPKEVTQVSAARLGDGVAATGCGLVWCSRWGGAECVADTGGVVYEWLCCRRRLIFGITSG